MSTITVCDRCGVAIIGTLDVGHVTTSYGISVGRFSGDYCPNCFGTIRNAMLLEPTLSTDTKWDEVESSKNKINPLHRLWNWWISIADCGDL